MTHYSENNLYYQGLLIHRQADTGLACLTDLWKAQGSPAKNRPLAWMCLEATQELLKRLVEQTGADPIWSERKQKAHPSEPIITEIPGLLETIREGGELLTYASTELAVVYARFLSVECYEWVLANLVEGSEDEANYLEHVEARAKAKRQREFSRRALIAAGWAVPVVLGVGLSKVSSASSISPHLDGPPDAHADAGGPGGPPPHIDGPLPIFHIDGP